ncbi:MAG: radical SAM protein [Firmicutes bacterium]|nr:radical SAM protein [Bacillota bacterium]
MHEGGAGRVAPGAGTSGPDRFAEVLATLDRDTRRLLDAAWEVRSARPPVVRLDTLTATGAVSVTGGVCAAGCAHCGGHYLRGMLTPEEARRLASTPGAGVSSWLVSGGCDAEGRVPLLEHEGLLAELRKVGSLNLHTGLVRSPEEARRVAGYADTVSLDFVVDGPTIAEAYRFRATGRDFVRSYELLARWVRVVPHVLVGLRAGRLAGEMEALRRLKELGPPAVVFLVLIPTPGSRFAGVSPPPPGEVARLLAEARVLLPDVALHLGCMRPKGSYRAVLDLLALRAGVERVAVPTPAVTRVAAELGLEVRWSRECCVFGQAGGERGDGRPVRREAAVREEEGTC